MSSPDPALRIAELEALLAQSQATVARRTREIEQINVADRESQRNVEALLTQVEGMAEELASARDDAEGAARARSAFLATMSHEIRTPMNAILGMASILAESSLSAEQKEWTEVIRTSGDHLLTVINDILDFSKLESGRLPLESQPFQPEVVVEEALDIIAPLARKKEIELVYETDASVPMWALADAGRVRQVLVNYLSNAVKFTEQGEVLVTVSAGIPVGGRQVLHYSVKDDGIGIAEAQMGRLFRSFTQLDDTTHRRFGGTGLGLAICKRLAERMGGQAWAESSLGNGSTFHFTLDTGVHRHGERKRFSAGSVATLAGLRAWIVDDNPTNCRILRSYAEAWGMSVRATLSPTEALHWAAQRDACDLVLLDGRMPDLDGIELARKLRERYGAKLKLVVLSSIGFTVADQDGGTAVDGQLAKPVKREQLHQTLLRVFGRVPRSPPAVEPPPLDLQLQILVVEDNAVNLKIVVMMLERLGYRPGVAGNGREAIEALQRQPYDVILMDVQMPELDGIEATRFIHAEWPADRRPRIIALTAGVTEEERAECVAAGMDDFLHKPVMKVHLTRALERCRPLLQRTISA